MSILARDKKQLTYIYSSSSDLGKKVLGYVKAIDKNVEVIDIDKEKLGDTIWVELRDELNMSFDEIFEYNDKDNSDNFENYSSEDWLKIINNNPDYLDKPIAVNGDKVRLISNRSEILKFFGVDSAGLEKTFGHEEPTISSTTDEDKFIE